jgi:hypothetical protein
VIATPSNFPVFAVFTIACVVCCAEAALAEEIYSWKDESGTVHYSTVPKTNKAKPAVLPEINRENLSDRIQAIKSSVPPTCVNHGGVDCNAGRDSDGSVLCIDGFKDSVEPFVFACLEARLKVRDATLTDLDGQTISYRIGSPTPKANTLKYLTITLRNTAAIKAYDISVSIPWKYKQELPMDGPARIDGYGVGEYTLAFDRDVSATSILSILKEKPLTVSCTNCR